MQSNSLNKSLTKTSTSAKKISKALTDYNRTGKTREERTLGKKK